MPFGFKHVPLRVKLAGLSLMGLGVAASVPAIATAFSDRPDTPLTVASVADTSTDQAIQNEPLPELVFEAAAMQDEDKAIRSVLPRSETVLTAPLGSTEPVAQATSSPLPDSAPVAEVAGPGSEDVQQPGMLDRDMPDAMMTSPQPIIGSAAAPVGMSTITLALDHARVLRVVGDVGTLIIGNPSIADVSMPDPNTMILTGKSYGETNMVMLDPEGEIIAEQMLQVAARGENTVSVFRGVQRTTLSCSPTCEVRPMPGDNAEQLEAALGAFQARNDAALSAATGN